MKRNLYQKQLKTFLAKRNNRKSVAFCDTSSCLQLQKINKDCLLFRLKQKEMQFNETFNTVLLYTIVIAPD